MFQSNKGIIVGALTMLLAFVIVTTGQAIHNIDLFELDEDAVDDPDLGDDWDTLYDAWLIDPNTPGGSALAFSFIDDPVNDPTDDILSTKVKDTTDPLADWQWKFGEPNDKNDIEHAFAAAYSDPLTDDLIVYFGIDKLDNSGDAAIGIWFLQNPVTQIDDGTKNKPFSHGHRQGDLLVQSDFTNGGDIERLDVYVWDPDEEFAGIEVSPGSPLERLFPGQDCDILTGPVTDLACAQVNTQDEVAPWTYLYKPPGGVIVSPVFPPATFFEGGLNVGALLGRNACFAAILAETRQSQSETASLEDKALGGFNLCRIDVDKTGPEVSKVGDHVEYTVTVSNTGAITLYKESIVDDVVGDLTDGTHPAIISSDCGASLAAMPPGDSCTIVYQYTVLSTDPDPLINTVSVVYDSQDDLLGDEVSGFDDHSVNLVEPSITFDKVSDVTLSKEGDPVAYTLTLENTSSADTPDLSCTITDTALGISAALTLASGESHVITETLTMLALPDPFVNTAEVTCSPEGLPNNLTASDSVSVNLFQPSITLEKTGDELSKIGDPTDYTITQSNTSSPDTPELSCTITDAALGINKAVVLASGDTDVTSATAPIPAGATDPHVNTAGVSCTVVGFTNVLTASDSHSVNLFEPSIGVVKDCAPTEVAVGETVDYTITLSNTSSPDTPELNCTITDTLLGLNENVTLASGGNHVVNASRAVQAGDPNPVVNTAAVVCSLLEFPNQLDRSDSCSVDIVGCALSPGFWGGGEGTQKWDQLDCDPIAITAGFATTSPFPWVDPTPEDCYTGMSYFEVLKLSALGDVTRQLSFKYIAARLNEASVGVPSGIDTLLDQIDAYFASYPVCSAPAKGSPAELVGKNLLNQLNTYFTTVGEDNCPPTGDIIECPAP